ncbi:hypothetical protein [uncultured Methanobrevibacter sp.]|uniref:hypothetical protein n=1 Tax=uncultured Methanobrevibacter sp. TaxID=253161 RepID=UPI0025F68B21|nr:hypothetical protein [uncultured Methanobrevibacter sp.]
MICLSSVSAVDDSQFDSTVQAADESSQLDNVVIDEINDASDDFGLADSTVDSLDVKENVNLLSSANPNSEYEKRTVQVVLDNDYGVEDSYVKITPSVYDYRGNPIKGGILKLYRDYHKQNLIASVDISKGSSFLYYVPKYDEDRSSRSFPIFYTFDYIDEQNKINYSTCADVRFHSMKTNSLTINARDTNNNYASDGVLEINQGDSIYVSIENLAYKRNIANIKFYVAGIDEPVNIVTDNLIYNKITFDKDRFPPGEYILYGVYDGDVDAWDGVYIAPATSNKIIIKINAKDSKSDDGKTVKSSVNDTHVINSTFVNNTDPVEDKNVTRPVMDNITNNSTSLDNNDSS